jgi:hypothetical protein
MAIAAAGGTLGTLSQVSPEERQLKNERKRINGYIRAYSRNPENWNPSMVASLERLTTQYGIPFQRQVPKAGVMQNIGASVIGAVDGVAMDFIPDDWYSSESTRMAKNIGKGVGTAGAILATGGAALGAKGAIMGSKALATGARALGGAAAYTPTGQLSKQAIAGGQRAYQSYKGLANTDDIMRAVNKSPGELASLVKGKNLSTSQVDEVVDAIQGVHGNGAYAQKLAKQVKTAGAKPTDLSSTQIKNMVDELGTKKNASKKLFTTKTVKKKVKKGDVDPKTGQKNLFEGEEVIEESKKLVDNLKPIAEKANLTPKQIAELAKKLKDNKIDTLDDAAEWLIKSQKAVETGGLGAVSYMDAGIAAGAGLGALTPLAGLEPSRAQKEAADLDPYN